MLVLKIQPKPLVLASWSRKLYQLTAINPVKIKSLNLVEVMCFQPRFQISMTSCQNIMHHVHPIKHCRIESCSQRRQKRKACQEDLQTCHCLFWFLTDLKSKMTAQEQMKKMLDELMGTKRDGKIEFSGSSFSF